MLLSFGKICTSLGFAFNSSTLKPCECIGSFDYRGQHFAGVENI